MIKPSAKHSGIYFGGDILTLLLAFLISIFVFDKSDLQRADWIYFMYFFLVGFVIMYRNKLYDFDPESKFTSKLLSYLKAYTVLIALSYIAFNLFPALTPARNIITATIVGLPILGIPMNYLLAKAITHHRKAKSNTKYTLVAGVGNIAGNVEKYLHSDFSSGRRIKGFIKCKKEECVVEQDKIVGDLDNMHSYLKENPIDEIIIALPVKPSKKIKNILSVADYHGVRVKYVLDYQGLLGDKYKVTKEGNLVAVNVRQLPLDEKYAFYTKNTFDFLFALAALIFLAPVFLVIALLIKLDSPGPVFYSPIRVGKAGKAFRVFKFRSMRVNDAASGGTLSTQKDDPRITKLGKILRKYSLDELPQFINVLLGDMSVVGPRPHRSFLNQQLQASVDKYMIRHYFKPGITGWAQVNGWRGPTETDEQKVQRTKHDIWYMENWSLWLDIKIIYMTIFNRKVHSSAF